MKQMLCALALLAIVTACTANHALPATGSGETSIDPFASVTSAMSAPSDFSAASASSASLGATAGVYSMPQGQDTSSEAGFGSPSPSPSPNTAPTGSPDASQQGDSE
jgi:hypothetical protein